MTHSLPPPPHRPPPAPSSQPAMAVPSSATAPNAPATVRALPPSASLEVTVTAASRGVARGAHRWYGHFVHPAHQSAILARRHTPQPPDCRTERGGDGPAGDRGQRPATDPGPAGVAGSRRLIGPPDTAGRCRRNGHRHNRQPLPVPPRWPRRDRPPRTSANPPRAERSRTVTTARTTATAGPAAEPARSAPGATSAATNAGSVSTADAAQPARTTAAPGHAREPTRSAPGTSSAATRRRPKAGKPHRKALPLNHPQRTNGPRCLKTARLASWLSMA